MGYVPVLAFPSLLSGFLEPFHGPEPVGEEVRVASKGKVPVLEQGQRQTFAHSYIHWARLL